MATSARKKSPAESGSPVRKPASPSRGRKAAVKASASYTEPELREQLKKEIMAGDKGGKPGQWSARKAQLLAGEYKRRGGGFVGERTSAQKSLENWGDEQWKTADGGKAQREGGTSRYLPEAAWAQLSPDEKKATDAKKRRASRKGQQLVPNTAKAASAGRRARKTG